jgi:RNA polymerase-binding protein DksA
MSTTREARGTRSRLEAERARLEEVRTSLLDQSSPDEAERLATTELSLADQHPADIGTEMFEREKDLSIVEQVTAEIHDVERALRRLDEGSYGRCEACGRPIGAERLRARPAANLCVEDQARLERSNGHGH